MNTIVNTSYSRPNWDKLKELVDLGYVKQEQHPSEDLWIYDYTDKTQKEKNWNLETLISRGLIVNGQNEIVSRPFIKFFSFDQWESGIPEGPFKVYDKVDGCLGISYWAHGQIHLATRSSFVSPQAVKGSEMIQGLDYDFKPWITYLFEIIYPENRIIVDYQDEEKLVLLGAINTITGEEYDLDRFDYPFEKARTFKINHLSNLKDYETANAEGFIVKWENGFRLKFKFETYLKLSKLIKGINKKKVWELLWKNQDIDKYLEEVPDEFYPSIYKWKNEIEDNYINLNNEIVAVYKEIDQKLERKELAEVLTKEHHSIAPALFQMLDGKDHLPFVWKSIRPGNVKE